MSEPTSPPVSVPPLTEHKPVTPEQRQEQFLAVSKKAAGMAFEHMSRLTNLASLEPSQLFEIAFCMGDAHGVESAAVMLKNFFLLDTPNVSAEELAKYRALSLYFAGLLESVTLKPKTPSAPHG